jgi:hypothetical protein
MIDVNSLIKTHIVSDDQVAAYRCYNFRNNEPIDLKVSGEFREKRSHEGRWQKSNFA